MAYDAFISYSHAADGRLAPALQTGLQRLARPWYRVRALRVFRDDTGLAVNPHLWASIATALDDSAYFVLLASPEAATSPWVNREIEHFHSQDPPRPILTVLTDGTLVWDDARRDYDSRASSALPPALLGRFVDEPRHLDLRWARDETQLDLRHSRFREAVADLAAPMHHLPKDELESEDIRRHRRALRLARAAVAVLVVLMLAAVVAGGLAARNANRADDSARDARAQATATLSRQLAASSANALNDGRLDAALLLAVAANRAQTNPQARSSLLGALLAQPTLRTYLHGFGGDVGAVFAPSGTAMAASDSRRIRVWNVATGRLLFDRSIGPNSPPAGFAFRLSADGSTLAVAADQGGAITIWNVNAGRIERSLLSGAMVESMALSSDGSMLATGGGDGTITLWDVKAGTRLRPISSSQQDYVGDPEVRLARRASALEISPDDSTLAGATLVDISPDVQRIVARRWKVATGEELGAPLLGPVCACFTQSLDTLSFSLDGKSLRATTSPVFNPRTTGMFVAWDVASHRQLDARIYESAAQDESLVAVSPDGKFAVTRTQVQVRLHDTATGAIVGEPLGVPSSIGMETSPARFSPDGATLAVAGRDGPVRIYDARGANPRLGRRLQVDNSSAEVEALAPDGRTRALGHADGSVTLLDVGSGQPLARQPRGGLPRLAGVAFSPDGRTVVAAASDGMLSEWDVRSGRRVGSPFGSKLDCSAPFAFLVMVGRTAVFGCPRDSPTSGYSFMSWDLGLRKLEGRWTVADSESLDGLALSPNGRVLALGFRGSIRLVDARSGRPGRPKLEQGLSYLGPLVFSPDGSTLAGLGVEGLELWDLTTGRRRSPPVLVSTSGNVALAFSPDSRVIATGSVDGVVQLWDVGTATRLGAPLLGHTQSVYDLTFGRNGRILVSATVEPASSNAEREVIQWDLDYASWMASACRIVNRDLTRVEWELYAGPDVAYRRACDRAR